MAEPVVIEEGAVQSSPMSPRTMLLVIVSIVVVILLLFFYFYENGKKSAGPSFAKLPPPSTLATGGTITQDTLTQYAQTINASLPANENVFTEILPGNTQIFGQIQSANLSDTDLVNLYNTYNALFYPNGGGTLVTDLQAGSTSVWAPGDLSNAGAQLLNRLQQVTNQSTPAQ